jgi:arylformamidase
MTFTVTNIIDLSLELNSESFSMRTPAGFKKDMQFNMEVLKEHDSAEGGAQIVRGVTMRLHAGTHIDAPEHNIKGAAQIADIPLSTFIGDAVICDLRHLVPGGAITAQELEKGVGSIIRHGDRLLLRTDLNDQQYMSKEWQKISPHMTNSGTAWCAEKGVSVVGYDFFHGAVEPGVTRLMNNGIALHEKGILIMPYLKNLSAVKVPRFTLVCLPLRVIGAEASPVRAVALL